jgi:uncharacterized protein YkwD
LALSLFFAPSGLALTRAETNLVREINTTRAERGLVPLRVDATLARAARSHSLDMLRRDYFAHGDFGMRLLSFGVRARYLGENLAWGLGAYAEPANIVTRWLASPPHRANLLRPGFRRLGIAAPVGSFGGLEGATVITADFAGS